MVSFAKNYQNVPSNFIFRYSVDPQSPETHLIDKLKDKHAEVVPKVIYKDFIHTVRKPVIGKNGKPMMEKDKKTGELKPKVDVVYQYNSDEALEEFKTAVAEFFGIDRNTIIPFDKMPEEETDVNKWNVIVTPSDADTAAHRNDVLGVYLLAH
jgi:hypothetical protein